MTVNQLIRNLQSISDRGYGQADVRHYNWDGEYVTYDAVDHVRLQKTVSKDRLWVGSGELLTLPFVSL